MKSIVAQVLDHAAAAPDKTALADGKSSMTFSELAGNISFAASLLKDKYHLRKGDSAVIAADKQLEFVPLYFACHTLGVVTLPIAPDTNRNRYSFIKEKVRPSLVAGFQDTEAVSLSEFRGAADIDSLTVCTELDDLADIMFTTGTTGEPKGVQLTHRNISAAARNINTFIRNTPSDIEMIALPLSHSFGIGRMRCALSNGQTLIMLGGFANTKRFFRFIDEFKVTGFGMVPASWALLKKLSGMKIADFRNQLHYIEMGSAPMPIENKRDLMEALPDTRLCMFYGLTEAPRSTFMEFHEYSGRLTTNGRPSPNMNITIRDENGAEVPDGTEGEICVSGDAVTKGYLGLPKEESFWGDNFRTGDWGIRDNDGCITLKSRKKELINVGGKKVSPAEVEEVLMDFPFVKDCACIAVPDPGGILGEVVKAFIVTDEPGKIQHDELDRMIGRRLEDYKHPAAYEVIDSIPKTSSGKVQRLRLKQN